MNRGRVQEPLGVATDGKLADISTASRRSAYDGRFPAGGLGVLRPSTKPRLAGRWFGPSWRPPVGRRTASAISMGNSDTWIGWSCCTVLHTSTEELHNSPGFRATYIALRKEASMISFHWKT